MWVNKKHGRKKFKYAKSILLTMVYDMTNTKWGMLSVIERAGSISGKAAWRCRCDCGNICVVSGDNMRNGHTTSCGCEQKRIAKYESAKKRAELNPDANYNSHGDAGTKLYITWCSMKQRCSSSRDKNYHGRGIKVCDEWEEYEPFKKWALSNGYREDLTIERKDNDKDYCPENCTWIPRSEQSKNRRMNVMYTENGVTMCLAEWARVKGLTVSTVQHRRQRGWSLEKALNTPQKSTVVDGKWVRL